MKALLAAGLLALWPVVCPAADLKVATIDLPRVLAESREGREAAKSIQLKEVSFFRIPYSLLPEQNGVRTHFTEYGIRNPEHASRLRHSLDAQSLRLTRPQFKQRGIFDELHVVGEGL